MYHIWPAKCQIQLHPRKRVDHLDPAGLRAAPQCSIELFHAIRRGLGGMQQSYYMVARQRILNLSET